MAQLPKFQIKSVNVERLAQAPNLGLLSPQYRLAAADALRVFRGDILRSDAIRCPMLTTIYFHHEVCSDAALYFIL